MKKFTYLSAVIMLIMACEPEIKGSPDRFKNGVFEVPAVKGMSKSAIIRRDSLQIEKYTKYKEISTDSGVFTIEEKKIDTFFIQWKNNFFYTAKMKSPKTDIDRETMYYQITKISENSYDFSMRIGYSEFRQTGTVYKVSD